MLQHLHLRNFKGWRDTGPIELKPLTVLFGTNSSGKSSLEQFFLMLKQTVESSDRKSAFNAGDANSTVNLGSFEEFIHRRDMANALSFDFEWQLSSALTVEDRRSNLSFTGETMRFEAEVGRTSEKSAVPSPKNFKYSLRSGGKDALTVEVVRKEAAKPQYELRAAPYELLRNVMRPWPLGLPAKFYGFPDEVPAYYQNAKFVQDFSLALERLCRSISYLGPLRNKGQRLYYWTGGEPESVGVAGENTVSAMLAAKERQINFRPRQPRRAFQAAIAEKLKQLGLIDAFELRQISANRKEYEVKVKTPGGSEWVDLPDVGFGVAQVLPVVVQCFYAPAGSIIFIEQPELHLHPKAQAHLADLFIDVLKSAENGQPRRIQLIIETHSEHFLHRLQRRIAENDARHPITSGEVAAYFAHTTGSESKLEPLQIDLLGNILNWPPQFFGDTMGDLMEMQKAAARRLAKSGAVPATV